MAAEQYLREAQLTEALSSLQSRVREHPANAKDRIFLFQLLSVLGQWDRAAAQLKVANELDASTILLSQIYGRAIEAEAVRTRVFRGEATPDLIGEPDEWLAWLLQSLRLCAQGHHVEAAELRAKAFDDAPACAGAIDGAPFEWIADADSRLGPCLELVIENRYFWTPFTNIESIRMEQPSDLRDVVWTPSIITWRNGGQVSALIPTRYPGSESREDDTIRLSRRTDWQPLAEEAHAGLGQRMFVTSEGEHALLDVREINLVAS